MIVISGVLLLLAVVLLVIGLITAPLTWVYASIAVSLVSFVFLLLGVRQRRAVPVTSAGPEVSGVADSRLRTALATDDADVMVVPAGTNADDADAAPVLDDPAVTTPLDLAAQPAAPGEVLVVEGRPRYHVAGCRYLAGRDAEPRTLEEARAEGFTACGVCRPDSVVAEATPAPAAPARRTRATAEAPAADTAPAKATKRASTGSRPAATESAAKAAAARPDKATTAKATTAKAAPAKTGPAKTGAAKTGAAKSAPAKAPAEPAKAAKAAPAKAKAGGTVVVIPDRDRFHTPQCRFVRGIANAEELTRAQAQRVGYVPCGVCKP